MKDVTAERMFNCYTYSGYGNGDKIDSTEIYDPDFGSWRGGAALPSKRVGLMAAHIDGRVLFFGINI